MLPYLFLIALYAGRLFQHAGTEQLIARAGQAGASLNGASVHFNAPPVQTEGHTFVPLRETLSLFGLSVTHGDTVESIGGLSFAPALDSATFDGAVLPIEGNLLKRGDDVFIQAKLLADVIGARLSAGEHGEFYLTLVRTNEGDPTLPQPRFMTDKDIYAIGEPVKVEEFSFDPLGENVYLHWTNLQPGYFKAGPQTITLEANNREGHGNKISRTIVITDRVVNSPLEFSLKYSVIGDQIQDDSSVYPTLPRQNPESSGGPLLVSDSPEEATRPGALTRDTMQGAFRLLAYHINATDASARLCIAIKNVDSEPAVFRTERLGDAAPERIEGVLGQVTLMTYLTDRERSEYRLGPGESALVYVSPVLAARGGASVLADFGGDHRFEVTVAMTAGEAAPMPDTVASLETLSPDGRHARGIFPAAVRRFGLDLETKLPAKAIIGDPVEDPSEEGSDPMTGAKQTLDGNYGVTYEISLSHAKGVVAALAPRGGIYKGTIVVQDGTGRREIVRVPHEGVLSSVDRPMIFMRSDSPTVRLEFIPASGSQLPVHLVYYRP